MFYCKFFHPFVHTSISSFAYSLIALFNYYFIILLAFAFFILVRAVYTCVSLHLHRPFLLYWSIFVSFSKNITQILKYLQFGSNKEEKDIQKTWNKTAPHRYTWIITVGLSYIYNHDIKTKNTTSTFGLRKKFISKNY